MNKILEKLKKEGYKITKSRCEVVSVLCEAHEPVSVQAIFEKIGNTDLTSIYRTLNILENLSLVNVEVFKDRKIYCIASHPHHHIICRKCGKMESFECSHSFEGLKKFTNIEHKMIVTGVCEDCNL